MFKLILVVLAVAVAWSLVDLAGADERAQEARYAAQRIESQDVILAGLQGMNDATVSEFASDWRNTYPQPSPAALSELREIEQRIKNDTTVVAKMTRAYKMKNSPFCNGEVKAVISLSSPDCPPGL